MKSEVGFVCRDKKVDNWGTGEIGIHAAPVHASLPGWDRRVR